MRFNFQRLNSCDLLSCKFRIREKAYVVCVRFCVCARYSVRKYNAEKFPLFWPSSLSFLASFVGTQKSLSRKKTKNKTKQKKM